jgi:hypothetical protein
MNASRLLALGIGSVLCVASAIEAEQTPAKIVSIEELQKRIAANIDKAADQLKMNDPGQKTVKTQEDVLKDLRELRKQKSPSGASQNQPEKQSGTEGSVGQKKPTVEKDNAAIAGPAASDRAIQQKKRVAVDEPWNPLLPQIRRPEMETFARDQFMRRYENELREYYRAIADASRGD